MKFYWLLINRAGFGLAALIKNEGSKLNEADLLLIGRHLKRVRFYQKLNGFGYKLYLKPVKLYEQEDGATTRRKANCDVDMAFHLMKEKDERHPFRMPFTFSNLSISWAYYRSQ